MLLSMLLLSFLKIKVELIFEHLLIGNNLWNWSTSTLCTDLHELPIILSLTASRFSSYFCSALHFPLLESWSIIYWEREKKITKSLNEPDCFWNTFLISFVCCCCVKTFRKLGSYHLLRSMDVLYYFG